MFILPFKELEIGDIFTCDRRTPERETEYTKNPSALLTRMACPHCNKPTYYNASCNSEFGWGAFCTHCGLVEMTLEQAYKNAERRIWKLEPIIEAKERGEAPLLADMDLEWVLLDALERIEEREEHMKLNENATLKALCEAILSEFGWRHEGVTAIMENLLVWADMLLKFGEGEDE